MRSDGSGVLQPLESKSGPIYLPPEELDGVGPGDQVRVITSVGRKGKLKGRIIERLEERPIVSVGVIERMGKRNLVAVPMLGGGPVMIESPPDAREVAGLAVRVRVTEQQTTSRMAVGVIEEILGDPQDPKVQLAIAVIGQGLPTEFPEAVLDEVEKFPEPSDDCEDGRKDLQDVLQVTIDGADARDFDDAVGCVAEGARYRVWVSIADVSHYVQTKTRLDAEAYQRGTSVYFPHAVLPMLPERLSNDLCSLRPEVPRYAMTMEAVVGKDGVPQDVQVYPSLIKSRARLTYEDAENFLEDALSSHSVEGIAGMVRDLGVVSKWIRNERMDRGAVDLDLPESKVVMDDNGRPKDVVLRPRLQAHKLIEDLMVAANEAVARFLEANHIGGLYRIHESPTAEKLERLKSFLKPVGIRLDVKQVTEPGVLSDIVSKLQETERGAAVQQLVLQSMQQAKYSPENIGHFGLGSSHYLHFTSPIRRYPDLIVHRALKAFWSQKPGLDDLETAASWTSARERAAMDAERDIVALASCHVAKERLGESFKAVVVGVHPAGAFVRPVGFAVDGLVPRESLEDAWEDEVDFDEKRMHLQGYRTRESVTLGDELDVDLVGVDVMLRRIQFAMTAAVEKIHHQMGGDDRGRRSDTLLERARTRFGGSSKRSGNDNGGGRPPSRRRTRSDDDSFRGGRSERPSRRARDDDSFRGGRSERPSRRARDDDSFRGGRSERPSRRARDDDSFRGGRSERPSRRARDDDSFRGGRSERPSRRARDDDSFRGGRSERPSRRARDDDSFRGGRSERPSRRARDDDSSRGGRSERPSRRARDDGESYERRRPTKSGEESARHRAGSSDGRGARADSANTDSGRSKPRFTVKGGRPPGKGRGGDGGGAKRGGSRPGSKPGARNPKKR